MAFFTARWKSRGASVPSEYRANFTPAFCSAAGALGALSRSMSVRSDSVSSESACEPVSGQRMLSSTGTLAFFSNSTASGR